MGQSILINAFSDLKLIGLNPYSKYIKIITSILLIPSLIIASAAFMELFYHNRYEIDFIALFLETQAVSLQAIARLIALPLTSSKLIKIVSDFHELKNEFNVVIIEEKYRNLSKRLFKIFSFYKVVCILIIVINLAKPFIFKQNEFPYFIYQSEVLLTIPYYYIIYSLEILFHYIAYVVFVGLDILFIMLVHELCMHLQMLKYRLRNLGIGKINSKLDEEKCLKKIKKCVYYHIQLKRLGRNINEIFSFLLISLLIGITLQFCVGLYMLIYDRTLNFARVSNSLSKLIGYNLEFIIYSLLGSIVNQEFSKIANVVYECDWEMKFYPKIRKAFLIIIQYSQVDFYFMVLNCIEIRLTNIISVWQTTFSLYTLLQKMKE